MPVYNPTPAAGWYHTHFKGNVNGQVHNMSTPCCLTDKPCSGHQKSLQEHQQSNMPKQQVAKGMIEDFIKKSANPGHHGVTSKGTPTSKNIDMSSIPNVDTPPGVPNIPPQKQQMFDQVQNQLQGTNAPNPALYERHKNLGAHLDPKDLYNLLPRQHRQHYQQWENSLRPRANETLTKAQQVLRMALSADPTQLGLDMQPEQSNLFEEPKRKKLNPQIQVPTGKGNRKVISPFRDIKTEEDLTNLNDWKRNKGYIGNSPGEPSPMSFGFDPEQLDLNLPPGQMPNKSVVPAQNKSRQVIQDFLNKLRQTPQMLKDVGDYAKSVPQAFSGFKGKHEQQQPKHQAPSKMDNFVNWLNTQMDVSNVPRPQPQPARPRVKPNPPPKVLPQYRMENVRAKQVLEDFLKTVK